MSSAPQIATGQLSDCLFPLDSDPNLATYAIIDGAACPDLLSKIDETQPDFCCLYAGELEQDVEEVAPYLIRLEVDHPFTTWLFANIGRKPWGVFCRAPSTLRELRKHFRQFLIVKGPEGRNLYFRYYDPRVLPVFVESCDDKQLEMFFGPVNSYLGLMDDGQVFSLPGPRINP
jgi:Domain of unknown function (DUF4123)